MSFQQSKGTRSTTETTVFDWLLYCFSSLCPMVERLYTFCFVNPASVTSDNKILFCICCFTIKVCLNMFIRVYNLKISKKNKKLYYLLKQVYLFKYLTIFHCLFNKHHHVKEKVCKNIYQEYTTLNTGLENKYLLKLHKLPIFACRICELCVGLYFSTLYLPFKLDFKITCICL